MNSLRFDAGSYRDHRARIFEDHGRVFRALNNQAAEEYCWIDQSGLLSRLIADKLIIATKRAVDAPEIASRHYPLIVEHERIPFISYPYEWPFAALKKAALHHLELHRRALAGGATLIDASAYNIQFVGTEPIFIDIPSLRRYRTGEYWLAHQQFLDHFLNPLLCEALCGIDFQRLYRGDLDGLPSATLSRMIRPRHKLRPAVLMNVVIPSVLQKFASRNGQAVSTHERRPLSKGAYLALLNGLTRWVGSLHPHRGRSIWADYEKQHTYSDRELTAKQEFVAAYAAHTRPRLLLDLGCNTGAFSEVALQSGAHYVIGAEREAATADLAFERATRRKLNFLPLVIDAADPSPAQGWTGEERRSFVTRTCFDGLMALALEHHLALGRNIPLDQIIDWLVGLAPHGVIEFVPKTDPQAQRLLALRNYGFSAYTEQNFISLLSARARIVKQSPITSTGRTLFWFERGPQ